jgi:hypothetical protein
MRCRESSLGTSADSGRIEVFTPDCSRSRTALCVNNHKGGMYMSQKQCPSCRGDISADALVCMHCGAQLRRSRAEMMVAAVAEVDFRLHIPSSQCAARCETVYKDDNAARQQCLADCNAAGAMAEVAGRMHRQLAKTVFEVLWSRGNIDPVPDLTEQIIRRFSEEAAIPVK